MSTPPFQGRFFWGPKTGFFTKFSEFSACHNFWTPIARGLALETWVTWVNLQHPSEFDPLPVKTHRVINGSFPVFRHFGDVTVGGRSVGLTSGFEFSVGREVNRSTCSGVLLISAYFRSGDLENWKKMFTGSLACHTFGLYRRLRSAQPAALAVVVGGTLGGQVKRIGKSALTVEISLSVITFLFIDGFRWNQVRRDQEDRAQKKFQLNFGPLNCTMAY